MPEDNAPPSGEPPDPEAEAGGKAPTPVEDEWGTRYKYLLADFENFRRRADRDRESARHYGRADVLRVVVPLFETFQRAHRAAESLAEDHPMRRGLELLAHEWEALWKAEGVTPVARAGDRFRPEEHEAVAEAAAGPGSPTGTVVEVVQQGYRFPGGLLRPAKVVVARQFVDASTPEVATTPADTPADEPPG